jgi:DNA-binding FadR family transcriptional regulator
VSAAASHHHAPHATVAWKRPERDGPTKRAARLAARIADEVIADGWPVGEMLGSAGELTKRYDVSRAVFREAVRILEHQQVVRTRRGSMGGLFVSEPTLDAITDAAVLYLHRLDTTVREVFEARMLLEAIATELAARRLARGGRTRLRAHLAGERSGDITDPHVLHELLATLSGNPALELFVHILDRVSLLYMRDDLAVDAQTIASASRAHRRIVDAVLARDDAAAGRHMRRHLEAEWRFLEQRHATRPMMSTNAALASASAGKRAEVVAREIYLGVVAGHLTSGTYLGSEPDLLARHGVSRAVFREAVRLLEHHDVAAMRRGTGGGLYVAAPSPEAVTDVVALYLARRGTGLPAVAELRVRVEESLVDLVIDGLDDDGAAALDQAAELDEGAEQSAEAVHDLHTAMAALAGNRALELVALVLIRLTRFRQTRPLTDEAKVEIGRDVHRSHVAIVRSIRVGDRDRARSRMRRHLDALAAFLD